MKLAILSLILAIGLSVGAGVHASSFSVNFFEKISGIGPAFGTNEGGTPTVGPITLIGNVIVFYVFGFLGVIFLILTIYGGYLWMTAQGNEEQVTKARKIVVDGVIGMLVIVLAFTITNVIVDAVLKQTGTGTLLQ